MEWKVGQKVNHVSMGKGKIIVIDDESEDDDYSICVKFYKFKNPWWFTKEDNGLMLI